jgi:hypothetical protein
MKRTLVGPIALCSLFVFTSCTTRTYYRSPRRAQARVVYVDVAPPDPVVEVVSVAPDAGYVWIPGHYRYDRGTYLWVGGRWDYPPRGRTVWVTGRWQRSDRGWYWVSGRWN